MDSERDRKWSRETVSDRGLQLSDSKSNLMAVKRKRERGGESERQNATEPMK